MRGSHRYPITVEPGLISSIAGLLLEAGLTAKHPVSGHAMRPVICDGEIGKEQLLAAAERAIERLWHVKVVPRGYKRKSREQTMCPAPQAQSEPFSTRVPRCRSEPRRETAPSDDSEPGRMRAPFSESEPEHLKIPPAQSEPSGWRASNERSEPSLRESIISGERTKGQESTISAE